VFDSVGSSPHRLGSRADLQITLPAYRFLIPIYHLLQGLEDGVAFAEGEAQERG
jgi:hypothetical protein